MYIFLHFTRIKVCRCYVSSIFCIFFCFYNAFVFKRSYFKLFHESFLTFFLFSSVTLVFHKCKWSLWTWSYITNTFSDTTTMSSILKLQVVVIKEYSYCSSKIVVNIKSRKNNFFLFIYFFLYFLESPFLSLLKRH